MQDLPFGIPGSVQPEDFFSLIRGVRAIRRAERTAKYSKSQSENLKSVGEGVGISGAEERKHDNIIVNKRTGETLKEAIQDLKEYQDEKYIE